MNYYAKISQIDRIRMMNISITASLLETSENGGAVEMAKV